MRTDKELTMWILDSGNLQMYKSVKISISKYDSKTILSEPFMSNRKQTIKRVFASKKSDNFIETWYISLKICNEKKSFQRTFKLSTGLFKMYS